MHPWGKEVAVPCRAQRVHAKLHSINGGVPWAPPPGDPPYLPGGFGSDISPFGDFTALMELGGSLERFSGTNKAQQWRRSPKCFGRA